MSRMGKACLLLAVLFLLATGMGYVAISFFHSSLYVSLGLGLVFLLAAIIKDIRLYKEFFTMRTTKNGMAMGWLIILGFVVFACVNFLAVRYNKSWDWSSEDRNTLSDQSIKTMNSLKSEAKVVFLWRPGGEENADADLKNARDLVEMYQARSGNIKFESHNVLTRPDLAKKYEFRFGSSAMFVDYGDKHMRVEALSEEALTKTLLKITRDKKKVVYVVQGHKERALDMADAEAISFFKKDLEVIYDVKQLTLFEGGNKVPDDAAVLAVIGPIQPLFPAEIDAIKEFASRGGSFLVAADPGEKHNIAQVMKLFGVEYQNEYVLDPRYMVPGMGTVAALGATYSESNDITKNLVGLPTLSVLASSLKAAPDAPKDFLLEPLVSTNEVAIGTRELTERPVQSSKGPHVIVYSSVGKMEGSEKPFTAILFGDSDQFKNQFYDKYSNRDLAMNSVAALAKDEDIISIRPKDPAGTSISNKQMPYIRALIIALLVAPVIMIFSGFGLWFRRRSA